MAMAAVESVDVPLVFRSFDTDGNGTITKEELKQVLQDLDPIAWTDAATDNLLAASDKNGDGKITLTEFWSWLTSDDTVNNEKVQATIPQAVSEQKAREAAKNAAFEEHEAKRAEAVRIAAVQAKKESEKEAGLRFSKTTFVENRMNIGVSKEVALELFKMADTDGDGDLDKEEFGMLMSGEANSALQVKAIFNKGCGPSSGEALGATNANDQAFRQLMFTFKRWDTDGDGTISAEELTSVVRTLNPRIGQRAIDMMLEDADTNKDGLIDMWEFIIWLCGGNVKKKQDREAQKALICCGVHKERSEQARRASSELQFSFEEVQHGVLQKYITKKKIKAKCNTLNHCRDCLPVCEKCTSRHIWLCHGCGFMCYFDNCTNGCDREAFGWSCISGKCAGGRCGCKKKPEFWQRRGWAMDIDKLHVDVQTIVERSRAESAAESVEPEGGTGPS
eukprot:TRINITY_DN42727_c0_g1_i1.p1 TRINITY_DN42727_c0_g1~~TRINITY_DN42727_c0_g1_i1.p1  ORF type:complete len:449 (+),score=93.16 TRINITY_DN42727_c0_g1_i1:96-1442(+)